MNFFKLYFALMVGFSLSANAQQRIGGLVSNNTTSLPITGYGTLFYSQYHPGIDVFWEIKLNKKTQNQFWFNADLGGYYHRFFQTAIKLQANLNYRLAISQVLAFDLAIGGGYLHSFTNYDRFKLNENGQYEKISTLEGRPQFIAGFMFGANIGLLKSNLDKIRLLIQFRTNLQGPFAGSYIALIPLNTFSLGISFALPHKASINEK